MKDWTVLKDRNIINLLIGDKTVEYDPFIDYKMPYMTANNICNFGYELGIAADYWKDQKLSRWEYMENVITYTIDNNIINKFFKNILSLKRFKNIGELDPYRSASELYWMLINELMQRINEILFFETCHIEYNFETYQFNLIDDEADIKIESENLDKIDRKYVAQIKEQIIKNIKDGDYESVITKSRELLEEVMHYGIELKGETIDAKGNINKLYQKFKSLYNMHQNKDMDKRINDLLSGLEKIVTSISDMRDVSSDSHGAGSKRIKIKKHHAVLISNSAITMAEFLLAIVNEKIRG